MGGISAIFGLGRRQQEKVTAAALERCETPQRFIVTARPARAVASWAAELERVGQARPPPRAGRTGRTPTRT